jgi:nitrite reductase/ring-hydroxylating ferredoxin subunit
MGKRAFLAHRTDIPSSGILATEVEGRRLCVCVLDGRVHIVDDRCPHQGYALSRTGCLIGGRLLCGLHGSTFDLATGQSCRPPAIGSVRVYRAVLEDDKIWVYLDEIAASQVAS